MTTHRERILGQARADLTALPDLDEERQRMDAGERHHDISRFRGKVIGSPSPADMPQVHLGDTRHKPGWHGADPRYPTWVLTWGRDPATGQPLQQRRYASRTIAHDALTRLPMADQDTARIHCWSTADQYGTAPTLETWVRVLSDSLTDSHQLTEKEAWIRQQWGRDLPEVLELTEVATVRSECASLIEHWGWITEQQWAIELAEGVIAMTRDIRVQLGERPELQLKCSQCGNPAYIQPGGILACTEVPDHDIVIRDLEQQLRRRPALPTKDICEEFDLEPGTLRVWKHRRKIKPAPPNGTRRDHWFPWDVFCLVNPEIAEAFERRDEVDAQ